MKIVEAQSATLTNFEVLEHLVEQRARYEERGKIVEGAKSIEKEKGIKARRSKKGPANLETVVKELLDYLRGLPSPLGEANLKYNEESMRSLVIQLRPYELTKAEILMIFNHRPTMVIQLDVIVEELPNRLSSDEQLAVIDIIKDVLGSPDITANLESMTATAQSGRRDAARTSRGLKIEAE